LFLGRGGGGKLEERRRLGRWKGRYISVKDVCAD